MNRRLRMLGVVIAWLCAAFGVLVVVLWAWTTRGSVGESIDLGGGLQFRVSPAGIGIDRVTPIPTAVGQQEHPEYMGPFFRADPVVAVSYPMAALAAAAFPIVVVLLRMRRRVVERSRRQSGLCVTCGYNLAFTPDRCPECGRVADA
ncbi:MAG TPA: hypothetical protein VGF26_30810 [Ramlibacter sp.]